MRLIGQQRVAAATLFIFLSHSQTIIAVIIHPMNKLAAAVAIFAILLVILALHYWNKEPFTASRQRAATIISWFSKNQKPKFTTYREQVDGGDIVEYADAISLKRNGQLNIDSLSSVLIG